MSRVTLGVILPGHPDYIQKRGPVFKVFEKICIYGWMVLAGIAVILLLLSVITLEEIFATIGVCCLPLAGALFVCWLIWQEPCRCPCCKHFFTLYRITANQYVDSSEREISRRVYDNDSGLIFASDGSSAYYTRNSSHKEHGKEVTKRYTYNMRCSLCGSVCKLETTRSSEQY